MGKATASEILGGLAVSKNSYAEKETLFCAFSHLDTGCGEKKATVHRPVACEYFNDEGYDRGQNWRMDCGTSSTLTQRNRSRSVNYWAKRWQDFKC